MGLWDLGLTIVTVMEPTPQALKHLLLTALQDVRMLPEHVRATCLPSFTNCWQQWVVILHACNGR